MTMTTSESQNFEKEGVVSVWYSTTPYVTIPDSYFDEDDNGLCQWAHNFKIADYNHDNMETNGAEQGVVSIDKAVGECSFSRSYSEKVKRKINKLGDKEVTWVILLFDFEYRAKKTRIDQDQYVQFVGAFPYDMAQDSVFDVGG